MRPPAGEGDGLRIVQLVTRRQRRGAEVYAADLSVALARRGHEVHYAGLTRPPEEPLEPEAVRSWDVSRAPVGVLRPTTILRLARFLRRIRPDVVQANGGYAVKCAALATRSIGSRVPLVYCNVGLSSDWLRRPGQRAWNTWLMRRVDRVAAVGEASRRDLIETYGIEATAVRVIRRGPPLAPVHGRAAGRAVLEAAGVPRGSRVMLHVGRFTPEKNHAGLLRIARRVRERNESARLVLVGDGPLRSEIESKASPGVQVLGVRSDVSSLMAGSDVLVLPSRTEGVPGVVLEAAVQGLPAVAYDVGGVSEVVRDGRTGRLVPRGDEAAAADAILDLLGDDALRRDLGSHARDLVRREHDLERSVEAFEDLYEDARRTDR